MYLGVNIMLCALIFIIFFSSGLQLSFNQFRDFKISTHCAFMQMCSYSRVWCLDVAQPSRFIIFNSSQSSKSAFILNDLSESAGVQAAKLSTAYPFWDKGIYCQVICFCSHFVYVSCRWTWVFKHVSWCDGGLLMLGSELEQENKDSLCILT